MESTAAEASVASVRDQVESLVTPSVERELPPDVSTFAEP